MPSLPINSSTDGLLLVAAPPPRQFIRVLGLDLTAAGQVVVSLKSGNSTVVWSTEAMDATGAGGIVLNVDPNRTIDCLPGEGLNLGLSAGVTVRGSIEYVVLGPPDTN